MAKGKQKPNRPAPKRKDRPNPDVPDRKTKVTPSSSVLPGSDGSEERICWRFAHADRDGRWGWDRISTEDWCEIRMKMSACESMTVAELTTTWRLFKSYDVEDALVPAAVSRLDELRLGDLTKIHRIEFTGLKRLYGVLQGNVFHVIWWDPNHEICPSHKKHT